MPPTRRRSPRTRRRGVGKTTRCSRGGAKGSAANTTSTTRNGKAYNSMAHVRLAGRGKAGLTQKRQQQRDREEARLMRQANHTKPSPTSWADRDPSPADDRPIFGYPADPDAHKDASQQASWSLWH